MSPQDQQRLADVISTFIDGTDICRPFYVVTFGGNGAVSVSLHTRRDVKHVCGLNPNSIAPPITVTVVSAEDGRGSSAKIEFVAAKPTMQ